MRPDQLERVKEALLVLEGLTPQQQRTWIERRLSDDPAVRSEVLSLLEASKHADPRLQPVVSAPASDADGLGGTGSVQPTRIGRYLIEALIGQGAMGNVYRARQLAPVERVVAVKVLKPGAGAREMLARFESERHVIARFSHRNIASLLDAGADEGRPYLVMELVDGPPLTEYARLHGLSLHQRLELMLQTCRGVQHAHSRGVLHRDLKPSNVLVAEEDAQPVPKIIDFGVAKLLRPDAAGPAQTAIGQILGTVEYMSPEQADPRGVDADVRSDVYSLGVMLYELIADERPFDEHTLRGLSVPDLHRFLTTQRAVAPGRRATRSARVSAFRVGVPGRVSAELDCVTLKALEPDALQRYASAGELADDLERLLRGDVIRARPPTTLYLTSKFIRRHRIPVAAVALVLVGLLGVLVALSIGLRQAGREAARAEQQRVEAERAREEAERARSDAEEVAQYLKRVWAQGNPGQLGPGALLRDAAIREARSFLERHPTRPMVRARVALGLAEPLVEYNELDLAGRLVQLSLNTLEPERSPQAWSARFSALMLGARMRLLHRELDEASALLEQAAEVAREHLTPTETLRAEIIRSNVLMTRQDLAGALKAREAAIERAQADAASPGLKIPPTTMAWARSTLVRSYLATGQYERAVESGRPVVEAVRANPSDGDVGVLGVLSDVATSLIRLDRLDEARGVIELNLERAQSVFGPTHLHTFLARRLECLVSALSGAADASDRWAEQIELARHAGIPEVQIASWHPGLLEMQLILGRDEDAGRTADVGLGWLRSGAFEPAQRAGYVLAMAEQYALRGRPERARALLNDVCPYIRAELPGSPLIGACDRLEAMVNDPG